MNLVIGIMEETEITILIAGVAALVPITVSTGAVIVVKMNIVIKVDHWTGLSDHSSAINYLIMLLLYLLIMLRSCCLVT